MMPSRRTLLTAAAASIGLTATACSGDATEGSDDFPSQQITVVVPFDAGGGTDSITRTVAPYLEEHLDADILVENQPGGSGSIATNRVLGEAPDGYVVIMGAATPVIATPLFTDVGYEPTSLTAIGRSVAAPNVLVVPESSPYETSDAFFEAAVSGEHINIGVSGASSMQTIVIDLLNESLGTDLQSVPFDGAAGAVAAVRAGDVHATMGTTLDVAAIVKSGDARILAATEPDGVPEALGTDIPSLADQGIEPPIGSDWYGLMGPADMPAELVEQWSAALAYALEQEDVVETLNGIGAVPGYLPPSEFEKSIANEWETYLTVQK